MCLCSFVCPLMVLQFTAAYRPVLEKLVAYIAAYPRYSRGVVPQSAWYVERGEAVDPDDPEKPFFNNLPIHQATELTVLCRASIEAVCYQIQVCLANDHKEFRKCEFFMERFSWCVF